jgi:D-sedoheptulose 7-phosphate isomerase
MGFIESSEREMESLVSRYPILDRNRDNIRLAAEALIQTANSGGKILICGNGGSSADADHIVGELMKGFVHQRPLSLKKRDALKRIGGEEGARLGELLQQGIPAISLSAHSALNTAFINDVDPSLIFAQQVIGLGTEKDLLWGLSTSGNSGNVVCAAIAAKSLGMKTLAMTGNRESRLSDLCDICIKVDETETYKVQELHLPVYHALCLIIENELFNRG